jgi:hypothetical protein
MMWHVQKTQKLKKNSSILKPATNTQLPAAGRLIISA